MFFRASLFHLFSFLRGPLQCRRNTKNNRIGFQHFERERGAPKLRGLTVSILSREKDDDFREKTSENERRFAIVGRRGEMREAGE